MRGLVQHSQASDAQGIGMTEVLVNSDPTGLKALQPMPDISGGQQIQSLRAFPNQAIVSGLMASSGYEVFPTDTLHSGCPGTGLNKAREEEAADVRTIDDKL